MKWQKTKWVLLFALLFFLLGYLREYIFVHYNNVMYQVYYNSSSNLKTPSALEFLLTKPYHQLYYFKYPLTLFFVFVFFVLNYSCLKKLSGSPLTQKFLLASYLLLCISAALSMAYAYFICNNLGDDEYTFSRWLLGIAQSPIICLFLLASEKLISKSPQHD